MDLTSKASTVNTAIKAMPLAVVVARRASGAVVAAIVGCSLAGSSSPVRRQQTMGADASMKVNCSKCSQPIALTDIVESNNGGLSHANCAQPRTLALDERTLLFLYCADHIVAKCLPCGLSFRFGQFAADPLGWGRRAYDCLRCQKSLTENVRSHLYGCAKQPVEVRLWAQAVMEAAQHLVKQKQQNDMSERLIRQAEALLFERQRALRGAMSRRAAS